MRIDSSSGKPSASSASRDSFAKDVGGIWFESPHTIALRPRPIAPTAEATVICDASSKTTTSKSWRSAGKKRATESGETSTHGVMSVMRSPYSPTRSRIPRARTRLANSRLRSSRRVPCPSRRSRWEARARAMRPWGSRARSEARSSA